MEMRVVPSFPNYAATSDGRIFNVAYGMRRVMGFRHEDGYQVVTMRKDGKRKDVKIHRLVLEAFFGPSTKVARHLDGDPQNNAISNLCYGTMKENAEDRDKHGKTPKGENRWCVKLTVEDVLWIRAQLKTGRSANGIAKELNVAAGTIAYIRSGRNWKHVGE